jgi:hypothetical protein
MVLLNPGCSSDSVGANIDTDNLTNKQIETILSAYDDSKSEFSNLELEDGSDVYIDLSDGIWDYSYANRANKNIIKNLISVSSSEQANFFDLSDNQITRIKSSHEDYFINGNCSEGQKKFHNNQGKKKQAAPLKQAIDQIAKSNKISVLVTDGEFAKGNPPTIIADAWAAESMGLWFSKGHELSIIYTDFDTESDGNIYKKHMYLMFFIPNGYNGDLLTNLEDDLKEDDLIYEKLDFSTDFKNLWTRDYLNSTTPGTNKFNTDYDIPLFFKGDNFEFIDLSKDCFSMLGNIGLVTTVRDGFNQDGVQTGFPLIEKLKFQFNQLENYEVDELSINVTNITADFNQFMKNYFALKNLPIIHQSGGKDSLDEDNYLVFDFENTPTINMEWPYNMENKTGVDTVNNFYSMLTKSYEYTSSNEIKVVDFLEIDLAAGKASTESTQDNVFEVVINIDEKLNESTKNLNLDQPTLIKLDIIVEKDQIKLKDLNKDALTWETLPPLNKNLKTDNSLYKSIKNPLTSNRKQKKVLYTYYLKFPSLTD